MNYILAFYLFCLIFGIIWAVVKHMTIKKKPMTNKHVVITGGSSGLGIALAQDSLNLGASHITLIARKMDQLEKAAKALKHNSNQQIHLFSADVTNYESLKAAFDSIAKTGAKIDYLFPNAGYARPGLYDELEYTDYDNLIKTNYLGAVYTCKLARPLMAKDSHITFSGSVCSTLSFIGYAAYGPSKYALKGFADSIRNEFCTDGINIHMGILSSMDSPGFKIECQTKPKPCADIEGTVKLFTPEEISDHLLKGISRGDYCICMEPLVYILYALGASVCPSDNILLDIALGPLIPIVRILGTLYLDFFVKREGKKQKIE